MSAVWVAIGGAAGATARYWADAWITRLAGAGFPWGTLVINVVGSVAIGVWFALTPPTRAASASHLLVAVGILGGFTTFSAFSMQTLALAQAGEWGRAGGYIAGSLVLCLAGVWAGFSAAVAARG
jgi:CrcB protein